MNTILGAVTLGIALLPTIVIMGLVLANARFKREPIKKVASVFGISALSTLPAIILELLGTLVLALIVYLFSIDLEKQSGVAAYEFLEYMLIVGPVEEACKYFTFKWMIFHDRDFDNTYDGVIYGAASALGFATLENLMYVFVGNDAQLQTAVMRALLSVPMHAITGIVMGYWFGISKYRRYNNIQPDTHPERKAFIFSVVLHGAYDFIVTVPSIYSDSSAVESVSLTVLIGVMLFIYVLMGKTISRAKRETHNIYNRYYYEQLDGAMQDRIGGKTSEKKRFFGWLPFARQPMGFNPYNPYQGMNLAPVPVQQNAAYVYGTQQPYNPYYSRPAGQPPQWGQQPQPAYAGAQPQQYAQPQPQYTQPQQQPMGEQARFQPQGNQPQLVYGPPSALRNSPIPGNGYTQPPQPPVQEQPKVFCGNCGAPQKAGTKYCRMCGSRIEGQ